MIRSAVKFKNSENSQTFTAKISMRFILLQKWCKLVFPYLMRAKCPSYKTFSSFIKPKLLRSNKNVPYDKLHQNVDSFSNISEISSIHTSEAQLLFSHDLHGIEKKYPMHYKR
jgi:hypothetical protein